MRKPSNDEAGERMVPDGGEMVMIAVDALVGTIAMIVVLFEMIKLSALKPPNWTADAAVKLVPLITTLVAGRPFVGEKLVNLGATKKLVAVEITFVAVLKLCVAPNFDIRTSGPEVTPVGAVTS